MNAIIRFVDLISVVHPGSGLRVMALLRAHFDASFTEPNGVAAIGGYLGSEEQWKAVEEKWLDNLAIWGLDRFHLTELLSGRTHLGFGKGELCALSFARILERSSLHSLYASFQEKDWLAEERQAMARMYPEPYHVCLGMLLTDLTTHMRREFPNDLVAIVVDSDTGHHQAAEAIFDHRRKFSDGVLASFTIASRKRFRLLECADLIAGEARKAWLNEQAWEYDETRELFSVAMGKRSHGVFWSAEANNSFDKLAPVILTKEQLDRLK